MGVEPKIGGFENPKMDGENNGKSYEQMDDLGGFPVFPLFLETPIYLVKLARDLTRPIYPKWWFSKGNPLCLGKSRLVKYCNLARYII